MKNITHIWFDLEGTLLKNPRYDAAVDDFAYQLYLQETGKQRSLETKKESDAFLKQHVRKSLIFVSLGKSKKFYAEAFATQFPFQQYVSQDKDVQAVISFLKQKRIGLGVYTSLPRDPLVKILSLLGLDAADFTLLSGDDVKKGKPSPEGFEKIIQLCNVAPEQIVFIGDSEFKDILPAKSVGMKTILVRSKELITTPDYGCKDFRELFGLLKKLV